MTDYDDRQDDQDAPAASYADFDAFFAEQTAPKPKREGTPLRLYGREYVLPPALPSLVALKIRQVQNSARPEDISGLLSALFGPTALDHWTSQGMDDRQFGIVLMWAIANAADPGSLSMERAAELYDEAERAKAAGKAPRPTTSRPPKKRKKRRSSGGRS